MSCNTVDVPAALVVAHPGHELRLFRWLERERPLVCVITDGSGSGVSRIHSTLELLGATGSTPGPVMGEFTDVQVYEFFLNHDISPVVEMTESIAVALTQHGVRSVVSDAFEFYNPTHDLCSVVAIIAAATAQKALGRRIQLYDYAVTVAASGDGVMVDLDAQEVERKLSAARNFTNLTRDVEELLASIGEHDVAREILRPVNMTIDLPLANRKPFYERHGEGKVAAGTYRSVLRYEEHFVPFVQSLAASFGQSLEFSSHAAVG